MNHKIVLLDSSQNKYSTRLQLAKRCYGYTPGSDENKLERVKKKLYDLGYGSTSVTVFALMCKMTGVPNFSKIDAFTIMDANDVIEFAKGDEEFGIIPTK